MHKSSSHTGIPGQARGCYAFYSTRLWNGTQADCDLVQTLPTCNILKFSWVEPCNIDNLYQKGDYIAGFISGGTGGAFTLGIDFPPPPLEIVRVAPLAFVSSLP